MTPELRVELERLLTGLLDDALGQAELFRLNEILAEDAEARRFYLEYVDLHVRLLHHPRLAAMAEAERQAELELKAELELRAEAERAELQQASPESPMPASISQPAAHNVPSVAVRSIASWPSYVLTIAATLAASLLLQFVLQRSADRREAAIEPGTKIAAVDPSQATAKPPVPQSLNAAEAKPTEVVKVVDAPAANSVTTPAPGSTPGLAADDAALAAENAVPIEPVKSLPVYVATLSQSADCDWPDRPDLHEGMRLAPSALRLRKGTATIRFDGGAELKLTGPSMLRIASLNSAVLHSGRVLFRSDDAAERFDLRTPHSQMLDYGTEYAVVVNPAGEELHVFDGEVVRKSPKDATAKSLSVPAGEARKFAAAGDMVGSIVPLDEQKLKAAPRRPTDVGRDADATLLAYEPFEYTSDRIPSREPGMHGVGWRDAWEMPSKGATAEFRSAPGFKRGFDPTGMLGGSLSSSRRASIVRNFEEPLRTDRDGAFYFSLLVRYVERKGPDGRPCDVQMSLLRTEEADPQQNLTIGMSWSTGTISICWLGGGANLSLPLEMQKVYLLTGKVVTSAAQPDQVFVRLFGQKQPVPAEEPARWTLASRPIETHAPFDAVQLQTLTTAPVSLDELRFGSTWSAVAAPYFTTFTAPIREAAARE